MYRPPSLYVTPGELSVQEIPQRLFVSLFIGIQVLQIIHHLRILQLLQIPRLLQTLQVYRIHGEFKAPTHPMIILVQLFIIRLLISSSGP